MKKTLKILFVTVLAAALCLAVVSCDFLGGEVKDCGEGNHVWSEGYTLVSEAACGVNQTGYPVCTVCGAKGETVELHNTALYHIWSEDYEIDTPAACEKNATAYRVCTLCEAHETSVALEGTALEHIWSDDHTIVTPAVCGVNATGYKTCTREGCTAHDTTVALEGTALEHVWSDGHTIVTAAACGVNATGYKTCTRVGCGAQDATVEIENTALFHSWSDDYAIATEATCGVNAIGYKYCTREGCTAHDTTVALEGTALSHLWSETYTEVTPATCLALATGYKTCTRENCEEQGTVESYGTLAEHTWSETYTEATAATCSAKATGYASCTVCQIAGNTVEYGELAAHTFGEIYTEVTAATCSAKATGYKTCTVCDTQGETVEYGELTDHSWGETYTDDKAATCLSLATHYLSCTVCSTPGESVEYGEYADHDYTGENATDDLKVADTDHNYYKSCKWCLAKDPDADTFTVACTYDQEILLSDNFASSATTSAPAQYYKSCVCGNVSTTETFGVGYPTFAAGTGVYYNDAGDYEVAKKDWDSLTSSEYATKNVTVSVSDSALNVPTGTWGYVLFTNSAAPTGTQHIVETDIKFDPVTFTSTASSGANRFACLTITSASDAAQARAFMQMYLHAWEDEDGDQVIEITGDGYTSDASGYTVAILNVGEWYNLRFVITEVVDEETNTITAVKYDAYINGMLVCEGRTKGTSASLATQKLNGIGFETRGNATSTIYLDNTVFGTYVEKIEIPEFVAGTGVYYTGTAVDLTYFTNKVVYNYDSGSVTDYANSATSSDAANTNELKNGALYSNHGSKWGHWYIKGSSATSDIHVFETDIMFTKGTITGSDMNFAWMGLSGNWSGGNSNMATMFYLNAVTGDAAEDGGNYIDAVKLEANYDSIQHTAYTFQTDTWYNLRIVAKRNADESKYYVDVYVNGVLVQKDFYVPAGTSSSIDLTGKITNFGVCWRGVTTSGVSIVFDNTFLGADLTPDE